MDLPKREYQITTRSAGQIERSVQKTFAISPWVLFRLFLQVSGGQPEGEIRLAVMVRESIDANVRLRLMANRTYKPSPLVSLFKKSGMGVSCQSWG